MNKSAMMLTYATFVLIMMSLFISSSPLMFVGKLFLIVVLSYILFDLSTRKRGYSTYHHFNILFSLSMIIFVIYALLFKGPLFPQVRLEFLLVSLVGLGLSFLYNPRRTRRVVLPPKRPAPQRVVRKAAPKKAKKVVKRKKAAKKKVAKKKATKKKATRKKAAKKVVKKTTKKKVAKKATRKVVRKAAPKKAKRVAKRKAPVKSSKRANQLDAKLISFHQDHEVAYILRKYGKRITKDNKAKLVSYGAKFKANTSFKPHNRQSFYKYMKQYKVLRKLN